MGVIFFSAVFHGAFFQPELLRMDALSVGVGKMPTAYGVTLGNET